MKTAQIIKKENFDIQQGTEKGFSLKSPRQL